MTPQFKQIRALLWLVCTGLPFLPFAQAGAHFKIHSTIRELARQLSSEMDLSPPPWEKSHAGDYYAAAEICVRFAQALRQMPPVRPPLHSAACYLGQFPDTADWQKREKQRMRLELDAASRRPQAERQIIFVRKGARGDGSSWRHAYGDLQTALAAVRAGQEIWVAAGVYFPTQDQNRDVSFVIPDSVRLYGGFAGHETELYQRQWDKNLTILSGEIGDPDMEDNSYTVVYTQWTGSHTLVDGFVITGGYSDGVQQLGDPRRSGGGWYNDGGGGRSDPTIANCLFIHNYARDGAGYYSFAGNGRANPTFIDCQFINNRADLDGGALFIDSREGFSEVKVNHCYFTDNRANFGSAIGNHSELGQSILYLERSVFETNIAYVRGVIHNAGDPSQGEELTFLKIERACRFADNISVVGGDENTTAEKSQGKKLRRGEIAYLAF